MALMQDYVAEIHDAFQYFPSDSVASRSLEEAFPHDARSLFEGGTDHGI